MVDCALELFEATLRNLKPFSALKMPYKRKMAYKKKGRGRFRTGRGRYPKKRRGRKGGAAFGRMLSLRMPRGSSGAGGSTSSAYIPDQYFCVHTYTGVMETSSSAVSVFFEYTPNNLFAVDSGSQNAQGAKKMNALWNRWRVSAFSWKVTYYNRAVGATYYRFAVCPYPNGTAPADIEAMTMNRRCKTKMVGSGGSSTIPSSGGATKATLSGYVTLDDLFGEKTIYNHQYSAQGTASVALPCALFIGSSNMDGNAAQEMQAYITIKMYARWSEPKDEVDPDTVRQVHIGPSFLQGEEKEEDEEDLEMVEVEKVPAVKRRIVPSRL